MTDKKRDDLMELVPITIQIEKYRYLALEAEGKAEGRSAEWALEDYLGDNDHWLDYIDDLAEQHEIPNPYGDEDEE